jgi:hypothetical protein
MAIHEHMPWRGILKGAVLAPAAARARPALPLPDPDRLPALLEHVRRGRVARPTASYTHGEDSSGAASWAVSLQAEWANKGPVARSPEGSAAQVKYMKEGYEPDLAKAPDPPVVNSVPCARLGRPAAGPRGIAR